MNHSRKIILTTLFILCGMQSWGYSQKTKNWEYRLELYMMASNIEGDASVGRIQGAPVDVDFGQILETLELGGMVHFEAIKNNEWGVLLDYGFMDLKDDLTGSRGGVAGANVRQGILEAMFASRFISGNNTFDLYSGLRWWDNDLRLSIDPGVLPGTVEPKVSEDWIDPVIGGRVFAPINEDWVFTAHLDLGGFGLASDFTLSASLGVQYQMTHSMILDLKYKALWVDFESGPRGTPIHFAYDTVTHGPIVGIIFEF